MSLALLLFAFLVQYYYYMPAALSFCLLFQKPVLELEAPLGAHSTPSKWSPHKRGWCHPASVQTCPRLARKSAPLRPSALTSHNCHHLRTRLPPHPLPPLITRHIIIATPTKMETTVPVKLELYEMNRPPPSWTRRPDTCTSGTGFSTRPRWESTSW